MGKSVVQHLDVLIGYHLEHRGKGRISTKQFISYFSIIESSGEDNSTSLDCF